MTKINGVPQSQYNVNNLKTDFDKNDIDLEEISILYTTEKKEENRTTFNETFDKVGVSENEQGEKFLNGLIDNKKDLMEKLNLTDDQYDSLACIALALASQETGMGEEKGYNEENKGLGQFFRSIGKQIDVWTGGGSASSGLTQMRIYDFLNNSSKLSQEQRYLLIEYGITADDISTNNLYENPDKSAVATMVVLKSITEKYDDYKNILSTGHVDLETKLGLNTETEKEAALQKGTDILSKIMDVYSTASDDKKEKIRNLLKDSFIASDDTKIGEIFDKNGNLLKPKYNEELQVSKLNKLLGDDAKINPSDLYYIRYALTEDSQEMSLTEFCAFGWNKGTTDNSLKIDRLLADKIGTILSNPENFDYDQFTVNVSTLALMYASQTVEKEMLL